MKYLVLSLLLVVAATNAFVVPLSVQQRYVKPLWSTAEESPTKTSSKKSSVFAKDQDEGGGVTKEHAAFKAWPEELIVSNGDYADEAWLEDHIGGPLYSKQKELPRLPVPELLDTVLKLLSSGMPVAKNKREKQYFGAACHTFPEQAAHLQERLLKHAEQCHERNASWLQQMWQTQGYLQVREPLSPCLSYFLFVPDDDTDSTLSSQKSDSEQQPGLKRAAAALYAMAESRQLICSGAMPYEAIASTPEAPLCSTGFKYIFHSTRIPQRNQDCYHLYDPAKYSHVIVATKGQFFAVEFCDPVTADPLPLAVLEERLQRCQDMAVSRSSSNSIEMGWLTSLNRDVWADARHELIEKGGDKMKDALELMESGAFVLSLDDDEPTTTTEAATEFWHGGKTSGGNRWHDKAAQLVISKNGKMAYVGEHSMLDAAPVIPLIRRILKTSYKRLSKRDSKDEAPQEGVSVEGGVKNIFADLWTEDPDLAVTATKLTAMAKEHHHEIIKDYEVNGMIYDKYGKKFFKQHGLAGNDVVQMAMQLASYRLFGKQQQVGTYEAALTRTFLHGRTETTRPVSFVSQAFVETMENDNCVREEKIAALKRAVQDHAEYVADASKGQGVDRHLLGLENMIQESDKHKPVLFSDPVFLRSKNWRLSTSAVIFCPGFGPSADDGIAVAYMVGSDSYQFTLTSLSKNKHVDKFAKLLEEALTEIGDLFIPSKED